MLHPSQLGYVVNFREDSLWKRWGECGVPKLLKVDGALWRVNKGSVILDSRYSVISPTKLMYVV